MDYTSRFRKLIEDRVEQRNHRTFGFEYELIAEEPLESQDLSRVRELLPALGFHSDRGFIINEAGMYITFEPGGQIEFSSPPMGYGDMGMFDDLLSTIGNTIGAIRSSTGIQYIPRPFIAGRDRAPMILEADRYRHLHDLLGKTSDRGREMMKGTAAIHFHAAICSSCELLRLWKLMCAMSRGEDFRMGSDRRDIWDRTDPSRCGLTCSGAQDIRSSGELVEKLVEFALKALDLKHGVPFENLRPEPGFEDFLVHFTTIFTDVRLNTRGMTLELRTPDTRPMHLFRGAWITFLDMVQRVMDDKD